ncbi:MarR family winged helix-turn-helix transcriptional regulator [Ponticaulis profundi]|uniref:MarR family winged helix-turn-helix transcriptional regulator n=1 Tax=Ponticaulis profundi TaxID=2665222 RepID=A0ABW1S4F7_9PROT
MTDENLDRGMLLLMAASRRLDVRLRSLVADEGLSPLEFSILMELLYDPGIDVTELRTRLGSTTPTIARVIAGLEKKDLILRPRQTGDGRRRALQLSERGNTLLLSAFAHLRKSMTQVYRQAGEPSVSGALDLLEAVAEFPPEDADP